MRSLLSVALLAFASFAQAEEPKYYLTDSGDVELRVAAVETKVASLEQRVTALEKSKMPPLRVEPKAELVKKAVAPVCTCEACECGLKASTKTATKIVVPQVIKAPMDHTHTCSKGHTWDHSMDGGTHKCPFCGEVQMTQDRKLRAVTGSAASETTYTIPSAMSGCANGKCSSSSTGWYLGKRLGR